MARQDVANGTYEDTTADDGLLGVPKETNSSTEEATRKEGRASCRGAGQLAHLNTPGAWCRGIYQTLKKLGFKKDNWYEVAEDKNRWEEEVLEGKLRPEKPNKKKPALGK